MGARTATAGQRDNGKKTPYGGYLQRDVPAADPELTSTDPGTPMGELMRRYWQPVCLSEELTDLAHPIRIMGEDLIAFRDLKGRVGVMHRHCSHRGTSLEFGLLTERGIRCCYHGWLFDIDGTILETPGEPENSRVKESVCQGAYPAFERHGLVFAYMGPPEDKPDFPVFDSIDVPGNKVYAFSNRYDCNWMQVHENVADQVHTTIFHNGVGNRALMEGAPPTPDSALPAVFCGDIPIMEYQITDGGRTMICITTRRVDDKVWVRHNHFIVPNYLEIAGVFEDADQQKYFAGVSHVRWNVPHDDSNSSVFAWRYFNKEADPKGKGDASKLGVQGGDFLGGQTGERPLADRRRYPGDWDIVTGQRAIAVHAKENMGATDEGVAMWRKICRDALRGKTPGAWPNPANGGDVHHKAYTHDTIFVLPELADAEADLEMQRAVGRRVTEIVLDDSLPPGKERRREIKKRLKALEKDCRRQYD